MHSELLKASDLRKTYRCGGRRVTVLDGVSLSVAAGEALAFLGTNGSGKTTTIKIISGLIVPDNGNVAIDGKDVSCRAALKRMGAVLEGNRNLYWKLTAEENLQYFGVLKGMTRATAVRRSGELLGRLRLHQYRRVPVQALSRGMQQRIAIAVALMHQPKVLLLDEPTLGLDFEATQSIISLIEDAVREGLALLLTTHQLDVAERLADQVAIIRGGRIAVRGTIDTVISQFSSRRYSIKVGGTLSPAQEMKLKTLGASMSGNDITLNGDTDGLYRLLDVLRPLSLLSIGQGRATLRDVLSGVIGEQEDDRTVCC